MGRTNVSGESNIGVSLEAAVDAALDFLTKAAKGDGTTNTSQMNSETFARRMRASRIILEYKLGVHLGDDERDEPDR